MNRLIKLSIIIVWIVFVSGCDFNKRTLDTLSLRLKEDITTLDPAFIVDVDGGKISAYLYNGLVRLNTKLEVIPDLAKRWEILDGGKRYRFYLKEGVLFSNGEVLKSQDVKKSFERILDPAVISPRSWIFEKVQGADKFVSGEKNEVIGFKVIDDITFEIILDEPFTPFLSILTTTNALVVIAKTGKNPDGTGPFILQNWQRGNKLVLSRNENYFESIPHIKKVVFRIIPEDFTAITEFENGLIDILDIPRSEFDDFRKNPRWVNCIYSTSGLNTYYLGFNCQQKPYSNPKFRKAVCSAINRTSIIKNYLDSRVEKADSPVHPMLISKDITYSPQMSYDPDYAVEMLRETGVVSVPTLYFSSDREQEGVAELIQNDLKRIGLTVKLEQLEWTAFKEKVSSGDAGMFLLSWWADYPDIENFLYPVFHSKNWGSAGNRVRYKNEKFDNLIDLARTTVDLDKQSGLYEDALNCVIQDTPWVCLWHKKKFSVTQPWVKGYSLSPVYSVEKGTEIKLEQDIR